MALKRNGYDLLNQEISNEISKILVVPYFGGGSTPDMDAVTPAVISGMRLNTTRGELFRAFMQGITYESMRGMDCLKEVGDYLKSYYCRWRRFPIGCMDADESRCLRA